MGKPGVERVAGVVGAMARAWGPVWEWLRGVLTRRGRVGIACGVAAVASVVLLCWPVGCKQNTVPPAPLLQERTIRVRIIEGVDRVSVAATQPPIYFTKSDPTLKELGLPRNV